MNKINGFIQGSKARYLTFAMVVMGVVAIAAPAFAVDDPATTSIKAGGDRVETVISEVGPYALLIAAGIFALTVGWRLFKKVAH